MAYGNKRYGRRRYNPRKKKFKRSFKRNSIRTLSKKVYRLARVSSMRKVVNRYSYTDQYSLVSPYIARTLTDPVSYTAVFGPTDTFDARKRWNSLKFSLDFQITVGNEPNIIDYTVFILSLKGTTANTTMMRCGQDLASMQTGLDFEILNGSAFINPNVYQIHYVKRLSLGVSDVLAGEDFKSKNIYDVQRRYYHKVPWKKMIGSGFQHTAFIDTPKDSIPDHAKLWLVIFNNNLQDLEFPTCRINCIWSLSTL